MAASRFAQVSNVLQKFPQRLEIAALAGSTVRTVFFLVLYSPFTDTFVQSSNIHDLSTSPLHVQYFSIYLLYW